MTTPSSFDPRHTATADRRPRPVAPPPARAAAPGPPGSGTGPTPDPDAPRPTPSGGTTPAAPPDRDLLVELARAIEVAHLDDGHPATLVAARRRDGHVELVRDPLERHPVAALAGFVAPPSWAWLGVVAGGWATRLDEGSPGSAVDGPDRFRVHLAHLVDRSGTVVRVLRDRRDDRVVVHVGEPDDVTTDARDRGAVDDHLRRALLLPTPPPGVGTEVLYGALWLDRVMTAAAGHRLLRASWADVAALHPVFDAVAEDRTLRAWATRHLPRAGELLATAHPWARTRAACRDGVGPVTGEVADLAGWYDDGSFARAVVGRLPPAEDLLADLHVLLPAAVHRRVIAAAAAWGLLDAPLA